MSCRDVFYDTFIAVLKLPFPQVCKPEERFQDVEAKLDDRCFRGCMIEGGVRWAVEKAV